MAAWSMLKRNTPLRAKSRLHRRARLKQRRKGFPPDVKEAIRVRDEGLCQVCGKYGDSKTHTAHHIHTLGQQGPNTVENGMWVCFQCHIYKIHAYPEWAYKNGYMVRGVGIVGKTVNTFPREG